MKFHFLFVLWLAIEHCSRAEVIDIKCASSDAECKKLPLIKGVNSSPANENETLADLLEEYDAVVDRATISTLIPVDFQQEDSKILKDIFGAKIATT